MLAERVVEWTRTFREEGMEEGIRKGLQQGIQQGIQRGLQQGEGEMLMHLLTLKFGTVPEEYRQRASEANPETLLLWAGRVLTAERIEDVFA